MRMADIPLANKAGIGDVLKRRLFVSHETDQFKPVHRTITEFLAATDLSKRVLNNSLPVERVLTLICGNDGKPVSPLRGLFAWLMCMFGPIAECYVARDPYGIVAYGDANVLPPSVQHAIWDSLQKLSDPWFLEKQEDRNLFGGLANSNTFDYIQKLLADSTIGVHLKIAIFDAIANSSENIGLALEETLWQEVLGNHDNVWLRSSALRAYARTVNYDWGKLKRLDQDLVQSTNDPNAPVVRAELLCRTKEFGEMGSRILSIMEHAASQLKKPSAYGYYHRLQNIPTGLDLDDVLDCRSQLNLT